MYKISTFLAIGQLKTITNALSCMQNETAAIICVTIYSEHRVDSTTQT